MIDPDVEITDVEPHGFAWLNDLVQKRPHQGWLWRLHEGELDAPALLAESGAERVVLLDRRHTGELSRAITAAARPDLTQTEWFREAERIFWSSPAVSTAPAPPERRPTLLEQVGDGELHVYRGDELVLALRVEAPAGRIVRITAGSRDATPTLRLTVAELEAFLAQSGSIL